MNREVAVGKADEGGRDLRKAAGVIAPGPEHWVGDGFFVRTVFHPMADPSVISPFLLLDHAAARSFDPSPFRRGVGEHPHRGFETVTFAYKGEVEHRDSSGGGGRIGPGDVQWMTAASGVVHEEKHSQQFSEAGGVFEMVQLWVNLPADDKMGEPRYQPLLNHQFPRFAVGGAEARLIAGSFEGQQGPAKTHTPMTIFDLRFDADGVSDFSVPSGWTVLAFVMEGKISAGDSDEDVAARHAIVFDPNSEGLIRLRGKESARVLFLSGEPIRDPVVAYGPFVMNTREQIIAAFKDYQSGKMGRLRE